MIDDIDLKEEMRQDMLQEAREEAYMEVQLRSDAEYFEQWMDSDIEEFITFKQKLESKQRYLEVMFNKYGWEFDPDNY